MRVQIGLVVVNIDRCLPHIVKLHNWLNRLICSCGALVATDAIRALIPHMLEEDVEEKGLALRILIEMQRNPDALTEETIVDILLGMGAALHTAQSPTGARCLWDAMYKRWGQTHREAFLLASRNVIGEDMVA